MRVARSRSTQEPSGSKTPHPGKRTTLCKKRREPCRVRYWSLMSESMCPTYAALMSSAEGW